MSLYRAFDASQPPGRPYPGAVGVMGYIGGNTPHVWTVAEWQAFAALAQWPIWVGAGEQDPAQHGDQAAAAAHALGWAPYRPNRRAIILDYEIEIDPAWVRAFDHQIWQAGFQTYIYGSASTVTSNPPAEGRWIALYNGQANLTGPGAVAHQYAPDVPWDGTQVDLSVVSATMLAHAGQGPRHS